MSSCSEEYPTVQKLSLSVRASDAPPASVCTAKLLRLHSHPTPKGTDNSSGGRPKELVRSGGSVCNRTSPPSHTNYALPPLPIIRPSPASQTGCGVRTRKHTSPHKRAPEHTHSQCQSAPHRPSPTLCHALAPNPHHPFTSQRTRHRWRENFSRRKVLRFDGASPVSSKASSAATGGWVRVVPWSMRRPCASTRSTRTNWRSVSPCQVKKKKP